jgi:ribosomal protein S11
MRELKRKDVLTHNLNFFLNYHFLLKHSLIKNNTKRFQKKKEFLSLNTSIELKKAQNIIYVHSKKRNTRISFCSQDGSHIFSYSMGSLGNKKSKRGNVFFVKDLCFRFLQELEKYKVDSFILCLNGFGRSRRPILRFFSKSSLRYKCLFIIDVTANSHNGCRLKSSRRL